MHEEAIERLLSGYASHDDAALGEVAQFLDAVRDAYPEVGTDGCQDAHLARMFEAAQLLADTGDPAARPVSNASGSDTQTAGLPKLRRIEMLKALMGSTKFKVIAASLALLVASAGTAFAASQGALPVPLQSAVSGAAGAVGIEMPDGDEPADVDDLDELGAVDSSEETGTVESDDVDSQDVDGVDETDSADDVDSQDVDEVDEVDEADEVDDEADQSDHKADAPHADEADDKSSDKVDSPDTHDADSDKSADESDEASADKSDSSDEPDSDSTTQDGSND